MVEQHVILHGEAGTLEIDVHWDTGGVIRGIRHDEQLFQTLPVPERLWGDIDRAKPFADQAPELFMKHAIGGRLFIDAILADRPGAPDFYDGLKTQEVIDAAVESHRSGARISIVGG
jgi:predicted dehydrogenase